MLLFRLHSVGVRWTWGLHRVRGRGGLRGGWRSRLRRILPERGEGVSWEEEEEEEEERERVELI